MMQLNSHSYRVASAKQHTGTRVATAARPSKQRCVPAGAHHSTLPTWQHHQHVSQRHAHQYSHRTAAAASDTVLTEQQRQQPVVDFLGVLNDMQTVKGTLQTAADPDLVYSILTDYDSCARVFRNIYGSETLTSDAGDKQVVQACKWQFLAFKGTFNVALNVLEQPHDRLLVFTLAESSFMKDFEGRWQVAAVPGGGSRIEHILAVKPLLSIPAAVAPYTSSIFKKQVAALLQDLEAEIDRQMAQTAASAN